MEVVRRGTIAEIFTRSLLLKAIFACLLANVIAVPCSELSRELRYPCRCELADDGADIYMDCDRVVFPGELPALPYGAPIVSFSQKWAGHQALPPQVFGDSALPLRSVDFSGNSLRRLTERMLLALRGTLVELRLADNLLGDTLNPIFSSSEFHGLTHLQTLDLSGNSIRAIEEGILKGCESLKDLYLDRNSLIFVPSASLNGPKALRSLFLSDNRIGTIKVGAFEAQQSMEKIDLSGNMLSTIEGGAFRDMQKLSQLKLSRNRLVRFNSDVFQGATNLQQLDLADNFMAEFPTEALRAFTSLRHLNLSSNLIQNVDNSDLESLVGLHQLDLSRNNIANIAPGTFLGLKQLRLLDLSVNSLRTIEDDAFEGLDNLETLSLKDNNVLLIPASALGRLPRLTSLRLDYNRVAALSGDILSSMAERVTTLILARNVVRELPAATFERFRQLQHLDLTGNLLTSLSADTFAGLERTLISLKAPQNRIGGGLNPLSLPALELLDLSDNRLTELSQDAFALMSALQYLNLSGNPLTSVPAGLARGPKLQILDLSFTGLRTLPAGLLADAPNIKRVFLSGNAIAELAEGTFADLRDLELVDLSHNGMTNVRPRAFVNAMNIRELRLNGNQLSTFKGETFNTGTGLEILNLSDNQIGYLFPTSFRIHPRLRELNAARNKLTYFPAELIAGLQYLERVDLSGNELKNVDELDFGRLPRLRTLMLGDNMIEAISEMAFHNSSQLQVLGLSGNKLDRLGERTFEGLVRLEMLDLSKNLLSELPDTIFERARLQQLENINLAGNLFEIPPLRALRGQYFFVSSVDLSHNRLEDIPADDSVLVNIKRLDLSYNPLSAESVENVLGEPKTVRELNLASTGITKLLRLETPFLRHLNLSHNNISALPDALFERTTLLETLDLSNNEIPAPAPHLWPLLKNIQSLDLSSNPIASIARGDLAGLEPLRQLGLRKLSKLSRLESGAFASVPNLEELNAYGYPKLGYLDVPGLLKNVPALERVNIETKEPALGADQLKSVLHPRLRELGVTGPRLATLSTGTLSGLKAPNVLIRLCNTSLTSLPPALFFPVPRSSTVTLDITGSKLGTLNAQTLAALDDRRGDLRVVGLDKNPITCDCGARALRRWLPTHRAPVIKCYAPEHLAGKILTEIPDDELTCEPRPTTTTQRLATRPTIMVTNYRAPVTTEPEIIWSIATPARPKLPATVAQSNNDDTLIIGIVGGVVAFIAILILVICVVRMRATTPRLPPVMGPPMGPGSSCACSAKGGAPPMYAPPYGPGYAATLPHKIHAQMQMAQAVPRHAYSTIGRIPQAHTPQPYFVAFPPEEKIYR